VSTSRPLRLPENRLRRPSRRRLDGTYLTQFDNQLERQRLRSNVGRFGLASNGTTSSFPIITYRWKHTLKLRLEPRRHGRPADPELQFVVRRPEPGGAQYWRRYRPYRVWNLTASYNGIPHVDPGRRRHQPDRCPSAVTNHSGYTYGYLSSAASPIGRAYNLRATYEF
jgi:iron complex outermembrane receptor protein